MTETLSLLILAFAAIAAALATVAAIMAARQTRLVGRRLHDVLQRLDHLIRMLPEPGRPNDIDALRVDVEWLVDTLTNELTVRKVPVDPQPS